MIQSIPAADIQFCFHLVIPSMIAVNQKQVMGLVASELSKRIGMGERIVLDRMMDKEKSNPSAIGDGCAIMNLQMSGLKESLNVFVRLKKPVFMNAADKKDVDLFCILLTPEREGSSYLRDLSRLSRFLKNDDMREKIRTAPDEKSLKIVLGQDKQRKMAA